MRLWKRKKVKPGYEHHPDFPAIDGKDYLSVLSGIERKRRVDWYLEIGSRTGSSLAGRTAKFVAVDPEFAITADVFNDSAQMHFIQQSSDDFFASGFLAKNGICPDLTFIDGMHLFEYALKDFMNAEMNMAGQGVICLHDICPFNYDMATRDIGYLTKHNRPWTGDVWKTMMILLEYRPDLKIDILSAQKTGLGCVTNLDPANAVLRDRYDEIVARYTGLELSEIGAGTYYGKFELCDPQDYLRRL